MALSPGDRHSYARPEFARVIHTHLELNVDFDAKVLNGKAILTIEKESSCISEVILDSYGLDILRVTDFSNKSDLEYEIGQCDKFGSKFTIQLQTIEWRDNRCNIKIKYKTSPKSPALYWLTCEQTADGEHPFLLSNNKYTYARAMFPCQDTPSVKFTYHAAIVAPMGFKVLMSAFLTRTTLISSKCKYEFFQKIPIPSYAVTIAVGSLQLYVKVGSRIGVWTENKYVSSTAFSHFLSLMETEEILKIAENVCGAYPWDSLDICVLPPSVSHFDIECPCLVFVSPTLLGGDISLISTVIARNISQHWAGILVTCANYEHLWLNKCFSMYIYRRILCKLLPDEDIRQFIFVRDLDNVKGLMKKSDVTGQWECLLPTKLISMLPDEATRYVPYGKRYILLVNLQNLLGGPSVFETFVKSYLTKFAGKSIRTYDWVSYLYDYFTAECDILDSINWSFWNEPNTLPPELFETKKLPSENACISLATRWIEWNDDTDNPPPFQSTDITNFCDLQKIYFLNYLRISDMILSKKKIFLMASTYQFDDQNDEIRFVWLRLCIESRWADKVPTAVDFAIKFCSPKFTYPIFEDLYEWSNEPEQSDIRSIVNNKYKLEGWKMLDKIKKNVALILYVNENVMSDRIKSDVDFHV